MGLFFLSPFLFFLSSFFLSPPFLFSPLFPFSPSCSLRHFNARAFFYLCLIFRAVQALLIHLPTLHKSLYMQWEEWALPLLSPRYVSIITLSQRPALLGHNAFTYYHRALNFRGAQCSRFFFPPANLGKPRTMKIFTNCLVLLVALGGLCQAPLVFCLRKSHHHSYLLPTLR